MFHLECVKNHLRVGYSTRYISFAFLECPTCHAPLSPLGYPVPEHNVALHWSPNQYIESITGPAAERNRLALITQDNVNSLNSLVIGWQTKIKEPIQMWLPLFGIFDVNDPVAEVFTLLTQHLQQKRLVEYLALQHLVIQGQLVRLHTVIFCDELWY